MFQEFFSEELAKSSTNFFIFDSNSDNSHLDIDFERYNWETDKFNKVSEGDLFIYRRPKGTSENNMFYFFGAGKVEKILKLEDKKVRAIISKAYPLEEYIYQNELDDFVWKFKTRGKNWGHFFNQYGMNKIEKEDFVNIMKRSISSSDYEPIQALDELEKLENKDYSTENKERLVNIRNGHTPFANEIKRNYFNKCAICSISTKDFLIASHIKPWAKDKENRLNPQNAICLCSFHDKAFDRGYISIDEKYKVILSTKINDPVLFTQLQKVQGKKIFIPKVMKPAESFLNYHRNEIFKT